MSEHILKTIEDLEAKASDHEREVVKIRTMINGLCEIAGMEKKYQIDGDALAPASATITQKIRPDQYFGKPLSTAVRDVLTMLRSANRAPAVVDVIYEMLVEGGYAFESRSREASVQSLNISIGKNSALFVKLNGGLIGLREWYDSAPRKKKKAGTNGDEADPDSEPQDQVEQQTNGGQPAPAAEGDPV